MTRATKIGKKRHVDAGGFKVQPIPARKNNGIPGRDRKVSLVLIEAIEYRS